MVVFVVPMLLLLYCIEYSHTLTTIRACMHRSYDEGTSQPFFFFGLAGLNINIHRRVNSIWCENNALRGKRVTWHGGGVSTTTAQSGWEWNVKNVDTFLPFTEYNKLNFLSPSYNYMLYYFGHCWFYMHVRCACVCDASLAAISHHRGKAYLLTTNSLFFYFCIFFFLCNIVWVEWMDRMVVVDVVTVVIWLMVVWCTANWPLGHNATTSYLIRIYCGPPLSPFTLPHNSHARTSTRKCYVLDIFWLFFARSAIIIIHWLV